MIEISRIVGIVRKDEWSEITMKFINRETGEVYSDILIVMYVHCEKCCECDGCKIKEPIQEYRGMGDPCSRFCVEHPAEAARLMGYEAVEDEQENKEENPVLTESEIEDIKTLKRLLPKEFDSVVCSARTDKRIIFLGYIGCWVMYLNPDSFPSLAPGESVRVEDIIENSELEEKS